MAADDLGHRITIAEAHALPESDFRELFCQVVDEITAEMAETFTEDVEFLRDGRAASSLTTTEMREAVLRYQYWFNPKPKALRQPEPLTIQMARGLLEMGAERGLKILFCEAVDALNTWLGQWSPLPAEPEKCSVAEILDLLERHSHWFLPASATVK